jgi:cytochrome c oxidase subunit III
LTPRPVIDVSRLPPFAFGARSLLWWGQMGVIAIEGMMFSLLIASYFYLRGREQDWPPPPLGPPDLLWGTVNTVILLGSLVPNEIYKRAAERLDLRRTQRWLVVSGLVALVFIAVRVVEFMHLNCRWSTTAYGSIVYALLGFHTLHLVTDFYDTTVLTALMFTRHVEGKRFVDVTENAIYWYFVAASWIPIYVTVYLAPRWL